MINNVAVLIPFYNGDPFIERCITSLTCDHKDIWIIDNSEISSSLIAEKYLALNHIITKEKKLGFGKAVNLGLKELTTAGYSSVIILNQDAYFKEGHFEIFSLAVENNRNQFICPLLYSEGFNNIIPFIKERYFRDGIPTIESSIEDYVGVVIGVSLSLINSLGGFDEQFFMYFEENDLFKRAPKERPILLIPKVHVAHRNKEEKMKGEELDWFYRSELYYAKKHLSISRYYFLKLKYHLRKLVK